jgi:hypothetical protein
MSDCIECFFSKERKHLLTSADVCLNHARIGEALQPSFIGPFTYRVIIIMAQYGLQGSITQIGVVTSGVPTSIQRQILATHKEP